MVSLILHIYKGNESDRFSLGRSILRLQEITVGVTFEIQYQN